MQKVKSKINNKIYYFRFWLGRNKNHFWYTETTESVGFNSGSIKDWEPIGKTWDELRNEPSNY